MTIEREMGRRTDHGAMPPFRAVVRYVGYKGWWWHIEDAEGNVLGFTGRPVTDPKEPDGVVLRGHARTQRGARSKARAALREAEYTIPPVGGWKSNHFSTTDGVAWAEENPA